MHLDERRAIFVKTKIEKMIFLEKHHLIHEKMYRHSLKIISIAFKRFRNFRMRSRCFFMNQEFFVNSLSQKKIR